jgi:nitrate/nitrite transporter NarK
MNIVSRFLGGAASDKAASSRGMRGRMWVMFILLLLQGVMCLLVGISHDSLGATVRNGALESSRLQSPVQLSVSHGVSHGVRLDLYDSVYIVLGKVSGFAKGGHLAA